MHQAEGAVSDVAPLLERLGAMEVRVGHRGFDDGVVLGSPAAHEIRALTCHPRADRTLVIASGDKRGAIRIGLFAADNGAPLNDAPWRVLPALPTADGYHRVVDALCAVTSERGDALVAATRGNGVWLLPMDMALDASVPFAPRQLSGSEGRVVRRLLYDAHSRTVWGAVETRLVGWQLDGAEARIVAEVDIGARATALGIDTGSTPDDDHLYIATNLSTLHRVRRSPGGAFEVTADTFLQQNAVWCGRASVIETIIPLSRIVRYDSASSAWVRRFDDRGVVATTLRHVMVMTDQQGAGLLCDTRRVAVYSKILAAAPVCLPKWAGIAVATLDGMIRLFRPSGIRRPGGDYHAYCEDAPESAAPRSLIGGYEDIDFLHERVYALATTPPDVATGDPRATIILGMGDHNVHFHRFRVGWEVREEATNLAREIVAKTTPEDLIRRLEERALHPNDPVLDKYVVSVLLPELGERCRNKELWRRLKLLVWDVLAGTDTPGLQKVPMHVVQSLRRLQTLCPERQEKIEQTITGIRKHIFDKESFSGKSHDFLNLTKSTDPDLKDDRVVYQSILISRRHDPVFRKKFVGEVRAFAAVQTREPATEPAAWRFLVATYRGTISIFDGDGTQSTVEGVSPDWGHVQSILVLERWVVFAFSKGSIRWIERRALERPVGSEPYPLQFETIVECKEIPRSLARIPGAAPDDDQFLWGDTMGAIHLGPYEDQVVARVDRDPKAYGDTAITVLQSFVAPIDGVERRFFVAGTDLGFVHLYEWGDDGEPRPWSKIRVGAGMVASILVHRVDLMQVVAGCIDGNVTGLWVIADEYGNPVLSTYWAFHAGDAVHDVQRLELNFGTGDATDRLIGIASHDQNIHVVDHVGRHLETIHLPGVKLDRFAVVPQPKDDVVECRVYGCAFENEFVSVSLISRRVMLQKLAKEVAALDDGERERRLTRWRSFAIREGHLRHRFVRQSRRYPGPDSDAVIGEIRRLMRPGSSDEALTGVVTALLRRLFQNEWPMEAKKPVAPMGMHEILGDVRKYTEAVTLLHHLEEQWDTPGSDPNARVLYFWIRSLLRNIEDLPMLRRWLDVGEAARAEIALAAPGELLYHFLEHPSELVQFKVLQSVERLLFGWPGVARPGVLASGEQVAPRDIEWVIGALLTRLQNEPAQIESDRPHRVILQIGKMLCDLVRAGCVDALYLAYKILDRRVSAEMFVTLARQCSVMAQPMARAAVHDRNGALTPEEQRARNAAEDARLGRAAALFTAIDDLRSRLREDAEIATVIAAVDGVVKYCDGTSSPGYREFLEKAARFYRAIQPILRVTTLTDITRLRADLLSNGNASSSPSYARLAEFRNVIDKLKVYYEKKYEDMEGASRLRALTFEHFNDARSAWRDLRDRLAAGGPDIPAVERLLIGRTAEVWDAVLREEQDQRLLLDLVEVVQGEAMEVRGMHSTTASQAVQRLQEAETFNAVALKNFLIRLVLFCEPARAALFHSVGDSEVGVFAYDAERDARPAIVQTDIAHWPDWLSRTWSMPSEVSRLEDSSVHSWLTAGTGLHWEVIGIPVIGEPHIRFGYFLIGWRSGSRGVASYDSAKLMWNLLLQSLIFRKASLQQDVLTSRVFSTVAHNLGSPVMQIRTNARLLVDGYLEDDSERRFEKYDQILRQGRHMQGIIDAILSIDGRKSSPQFTSLSLAELAYEVVRTMRVEAKGKLTIEYPRPTEEQVVETRFRTDEIRVYDILLQLVGNAVKYTPRSGTVQVSVSVKRHGAELRVRDEGPGVAEDEKLRILEPFVRGRASSNNNIPGLGLGLFVVDLYTQSLGGHVQIQKNESGRGASFIVFIPWPEEEEMETNAHAHPRD